MTGRAWSYFREGDLEASLEVVILSLRPEGGGGTSPGRPGEQHVQRLWGQSLDFLKSRHKAGVSTGWYVREIVVGKFGHRISQKPNPAESYKT